MAGFYPHIGSSSIGGYSPLPTVPITGILDSIVSDLGAGVNGWSLYDDLRGAAGAANPLYPPIYETCGIINRSYATWNASARSWTFTSGSQIAKSDLSYGYHWAYAISGFSGSPTPISVDKTNWYNAYYTTTVGNYVTATLDRNYTGATTFTPYVYQKLTKYVVLHCSSTQKDYYVLLGQMTERAGGPVLYTQVFETWNSGTHSGTNPSTMEHTFLIGAGNVPLSSRGQYIVWFLPEVFALWTRGLNDFTVPGVMWNETTNFSYIGNLDTSGTGSKASDPDALVFIPGNSTLSGMFAACSPPPMYVNANAVYPIGPVQCLRTYDGTVWKNFTTAVAPNVTGTDFYNGYHIWPRNRPYYMNPTAPSQDVQMRQHLTEVDLFHTSGPFHPYRVENAGPRGKLRYLKIPMMNPSYQWLGTLGPCSDGKTYITVISEAYTTAVPTAVETVCTKSRATTGQSNYMGSGWVHGPKNGFWNPGQVGLPSYGEFSALNQPMAHQPMHFAMPIG